MKTKNTVISQINGRVGILTFNRPHVLNAFNGALISETNEIMDRFIKDDTILAIVVNGAGRCFSAGFDMKESAARGTSSEAEWRDVLTRILILLCNSGMRQNQPLLLPIGIALAAPWNC